jgi:cytosine/adenosine deaminase-related metal-dependent hydrolase
MTPARTWFPLSGAVAPATRGAVARARAAGPVDPLTGPALALRGRVVTMDDAFQVRERATVYVDKGRIVAIRKEGEGPPVGHEGVAVVDTGGTLYPGLIELHNHLSYNALPLWQVPKLYQHRGQWPNHADYRPLISGPMTVIGQHRDADGLPSLLPALCRYVESKCLLGGVTTSQGVRLASNAGIQRFYRGIVRNVEQTDDPDLPEAQARIPDLVAKDAAKFLTRLKREDSCFLLHLSEGITPSGTADSMARKHFRALEIAAGGQWALNETFAGIHSAGLLEEDFSVLARHRSSMVWSPLSNLLLYGGTARVKQAQQAGVTIGLGSDWSPTGSKNLLGELKVAWLYSRLVLDGHFTARQIVSMATRDAARILKWERAAGSLEAGKRADLLVIDGAAGDAYETLLRARETDIRLVMINGIARYGVPEVMTALAPEGETVRVGGKTRRLYLEQKEADEAVRPVSLRTATRTLRDALRHIDRLAREAERRPAVRRRAALDAPTVPQWSLALDEIQDTGVEIRPRLPLDGPRDFTGPERVPRRSAALAKAAAPLSLVVKPVKLDPLTVADDSDFLDLMEAQPNVPEPIRRALRSLY